MSDPASVTANAIATTDPVDVVTNAAVAQTADIATAIETARTAVVACRASDHAMIDPETIDPETIDRETIDPETIGTIVTIDARAIPREIKRRSHAPPKSVDRSPA